MTDVFLRWFNQERNRRWFGDLALVLAWVIAVFLVGYLAFLVFLWFLLFTGWLVPG